MKAIRAACAVLFGMVGSVSRAADFRIVGSDLLGVEFTKAFYAFAGRNAIPATLVLDGSRPAIEQLKAGRADIGLVVLPPKEGPTLAGFELHPLGYHAVVVLAPAECPLESISFDQLARVFGSADSSAPGSNVRWAELGVKGEWAEDLIAPLLPAAGTGLALDHFRQVVLREGRVKRGVPRFSSTAELIGLCPARSRVLAIAAHAPASPQIKALRVAVSADQPGISATPETLYAGSYPLRLALQVAVRPDRRAAASQVGDFLYGAAAAELLRQAEIVPLPPRARVAAKESLRQKESR